MKIRLEKNGIKDGYNISIDGAESNFDVTRCWRIKRQGGGLDKPVWQLREWRDECWWGIKEWKAPEAENLSPDGFELRELQDRLVIELEAHLACKKPLPAPMRTAE